MNLETKTLERTFRLDLAPNPQLLLLVPQVIERIENDELGVYRPDDEDAFEIVIDNGTIRVHERATLNVSIREWLCVACQIIRFDSCEEEDSPRDSSGTLAWYQNNAMQVLIPPNTEHRPQGPAALTGEIVLTNSIQQWFCSPTDQDVGRFCFVLAHELVHVFEAMRVIVPAVMDWETFWEKALQRGTVCEAACEVGLLHLAALDDYGNENELLMIERYWPSLAQNWHDAFRGAEEEWD